MVKMSELDNFRFKLLLVLSAKSDLNGKRNRENADTEYGTEKYRKRFTCDLNVI